ncbi:MAG: hypothetical protein CVV48_02860 [Spirochaetae bacterium HGW-Spirochaetae-4]|nr:MAG: hypothetical protein CVV48_02860 [Spirochaetae bacterium HGW-Spirochaetae-4]HCS36281.1 hypothetical protein [Sphaerochaeta sp.]
MMQVVDKRDSRRQDLLLIVVSIVLGAGLLCIPTGLTDSGTSHKSARTVATILEVDNSLVKIIGPVAEGAQQLVIGITRGPFEGEVLESTNVLIGKKELDKFFKPGDRAFVVLDLTSDHSQVAYANIIDHYRTDKTIFLVLVFFLSLIAVSGWIGLKAIVSFIFTGIIIVKVLLPAFLWGVSPVLVAFGVVTILTAVIIFLVGGLSSKGLVAFLGSFAGVLTTMLLAIMFTHWFQLNGATSPFLESLTYSGFGHLDLVNMFIAGIFIASAGAVMDLAMDISAAMFEIREKYPGIPRTELFRSGLTVGRHAVGTMTTTLLLAYSGGYMGMLLTFIARGVPMENVLNMVYVSSELVHTLVGSFGLVLVAPFTAMAGSLVMVPFEPQEEAATTPVATQAADLVT